MEERLQIKIKKSFVQMFTGESVTFIASFLAGYFYALILGPEKYGVWQTAKVFISYSIIFTLSLPFVMRRDFVMLRSEGKFDEAQKIADLVFTYELFVSPTLSAGLILYALFFIKTYLLKISMMAVGFIYVSQFIGGYGNILAKGLNNYKLLKSAALLNAILTLISIPLVYLWGIEVLLLTTVLIAIANSVYYYIKRPFNFNVFWDNKLFKSLLLISFPLYLQDISTTIFDSIDRLVIAKYLNFSQVGFYSLSSLVIIPLRLLISSFSVVLFTQLNEKYGFLQNEEVISKHVLIPHKILSIIIPPLIGISIILIPYVVSVFLPKYGPGVVSAQISLFAAFIYLLNGFSANALFVVNQQKRTAIIYLTVGVLKTTLCFLSVYLGYGIVGIAVSTVIVYIILDFLMLRVVFNKLNKSTRLLLAHFIYELSPILWIACVSIMYFKFIYPYLVIQFAGRYQFFTPVLGVLFMVLCSAPLIVIGYKRVKTMLN